MPPKQPAARRTTTRRAAPAATDVRWTDAFQDETLEWLEADGLGGFASGCANGIRTRRYHALLLAALDPPTGRHALVSDVEVAVETAAGTFALSSHRYAGGTVHPDGASRMTAFAAEPWPHRRFVLGDGSTVDCELVVPHGSAGVLLRWTRTGDGPATLRVRPLLACRDAHALTAENAAFRFDADVAGARVAWSPYPGLPAIAAYANGAYAHRPDWYRRFLYAEERARGLDHVEDLAAPGTFEFDLAARPAVLALVAESDALPSPAFDRVRAAALDGTRAGALETAANAIATAERKRRAAFTTPLHRAADAYLVRRGSGRTVIAGYPWFTDWGRDTFIALRGLCLAGGRLDDAGAILGEWAGTVSAGMVPNRFVDEGGAPEFNSVDASLWFALAAAEYLEAASRARKKPAKAARARLEGAVRAVLDGYAAGTRHGIRLDDDGLVAGGEPGVQLTWMDAKAGDWVVTPRTGKPVEIQALWLNVLHATRGFAPGWEDLLERGVRSFRERFWNPETQALYDVVDVHHERGTVDGAIRPNMLFAAGGLPLCLLDEPRARRVVDVAEEHLWTPLGPRSLSPTHHDYRPAYTGDRRERDGAYHQGTVWPWLTGVFVEAWVRSRGSTAEAKREARERFVAPLLAHLGVAGIGHVSEVADGERPHTPRGCPFQAWSVSELLRLAVVLDGDGATHAAAPAAAVAR